MYHPLVNLDSKRSFIEDRLGITYAFHLVTNINAEGASAAAIAQTGIQI
jgi:hypothetical protein